MYTVGRLSLLKTIFNYERILFFFFICKLNQIIWVNVCFLYVVRGDEKEWPQMN